MPGTRTAVLSLLPYAYPEDLLPHGEGTLELGVEELGELLPEGRAVLLAVRDGGWQLAHAAIEDGGGEDNDGRACRDVCINFTKEFSPADAQAVIADALACGVSPDWGTPEILWNDYREDADDDSDENGRWEITGVRIE